jgi:hypothetical protein
MWKSLKMPIRKKAQFATNYLLYIEEIQKKIIHQNRATKVYLKHAFNLLPGLWLGPWLPPKLKLIEVRQLIGQDAQLLIWKLFSNPTWVRTQMSQNMLEDSK